MEGKIRVEEKRVLGLPPPPSLTVGVAIHGRSNSKYVVKWALEKFSREGKVVIKLLHVRPRTTSVPTPMGNFIPISQVREDVAAAYMKEVEWQAYQKLSPFKKTFTHNKVEVDVVIIESDDVPNAIAVEVTKRAINKLVVGASSRGMFKRKVNGQNLSSRISASTPSFCTVYAVSKGKLSSVRPSDSETNCGSIRDDISITSCSSDKSSSYTSRSHTNANTERSSSLPPDSPSPPMRQVQAPSTINQGHIHNRIGSVDTNHSRGQSLGVGNSGSQSSSAKSLIREHQLWASDLVSTSDAITDCSSFNSQAYVSFELEKLRIELRHARGVYAMAQNEATDASRKLTDLSKRHLEEAAKLKELNSREEKVKELALQDKNGYEAAIREAKHVRVCAEREASQRREAEMYAERDAKEKEKLKIALTGTGHQYRLFTWEEIESATSSFSSKLKIGMGAYGTVYKCSLHHTIAAVKVLHSQENHNADQFRKEIEILSKIRHPHLLILLGACPDHGCLVYEYMENGSLEERLRRVNNTPPIPWFDRFRIAWEVAAALFFLHNSKPTPIVHRDLKPANILLDHNLVSKIGDVGLSTMLHSDTSSVSLFKETAPVGTLCYIDPEYQRTGLISPQSDIYAFGMVILQLLTGKPAIALAHMVETAIDDNRLVEILDPEAGNWPLDETTELAMLGLKCVEMRRKDRPDLKDGVLPVLERLKEVASTTRHSIFQVKSTPPSHFMCPIHKGIMRDPCVAADGYTYDREAIEKWLQVNDKSPVTKVQLSNKNLLPNYTLLSAILEWNTLTLRK